MEGMEKEDLGVVTEEMDAAVLRVKGVLVALVERMESVDLEAIAVLEGLEDVMVKMVAEVLRAKEVLVDLAERMESVDLEVIAVPEVPEVAMAKMVAEVLEVLEVAMVKMVAEVPEVAMAKMVAEDPRVKKAARVIEASEVLVVVHPVLVVLKDPKVKLVRLVKPEKLVHRAPLGAVTLVISTLKCLHREEVLSLVEF